jgi:uncharacterized protein (TIGR02466 family)
MTPEKTLWPLFSKPIFRTSVDLTGLDLSKVEWIENYNNWISKSQNILEQPGFETLSQSAFDGVCEYFYGIMRANEKAEIAITESWLNKTEKGQIHHRHYHPNSIFSAIVYLQSEGESGQTKFITSEYQTIEYDIDESNLYNSKSWSITPKAGDMLVFPSSVEHMVTEYLGNTPRITLSFNTFLRGQINSLPLTRLSI